MIVYLGDYVSFVRGLVGDGSAGESLMFPNLQDGDWESPSYATDQHKTEKKTLKSVSFESIPSAIKDQTQKCVKTPSKFDPLKPALKQKMNSAKANQNQIHKRQLTLDRPQSSSALQKKSVVLNRTQKESQTQSKTFKRVSKPNSILKKTYTIEHGKEPTIVGEVVKRLSKSVPTSDLNSLQKSPTSNGKENINRSNTLVKTVVDHRNPVGEFDQWVIDRSLKIQQIHDELNKMVSESMENYIRSHNDDTRKLDENSQGTKHEEIGRGAEINSREDTSGQLQSDFIRTGLLDEHLLTTLNDSYECQEKPVKDVEHEYTEDFEEDIDENPIITDSSDSQDSHNQTVAEVESVLSSSNTNEDITEEEAGATSSSVVDLDKKCDGMSEKAEKRTKLLLADKLCNRDVMNSKQELDGTCNTDPEKVSTATSPIVFQSPLQPTTAVFINSSTSVEGLHMQVSAATSPINLPNPTLINADNTEKSANNDKEDVPSTVKSLRITDFGGMQLVAPPVELIPSSLESVLNLSLNKAETKSAQSTGSTVNLVVHLPNSTSMVSNQGDYSSIKPNISSLNRSESKSSGSNIYQEKLEENALNKIDEQPSSMKTVNDSGNVCKHRPSKEQAMKDIIEPTVAAVLKKIKETSSPIENPPISTSININKVESSRNFENFSAQYQQLEKPNLALQFRPRHFDAPVLPFYVVSNNTAEASNQTQAETNNVSVQVSKDFSGEVVVVNKATSARKNNDVEHVAVISYIEKLQAVAPSKGTASSEFGSSSGDLSSSSHCTSSYKSYQLHYGVHVMEKNKLSDGELPGEGCQCTVGEVCSSCVPKLDLSYGELKTNRLDRRKINSTSSDSESNQSSSTAVPLMNLPLHLEPRPCSIEGEFQVFDINKVTSNVRRNNRAEVNRNPYSTSGNQRQHQNKYFSDLVNYVLKDLRQEQDHNTMPSNSRSLINKFHDKDPRPEPFANSHKKEAKKMSCKPAKSSDIQKVNSKQPLVIKPPLEEPTCDIVLVDSEESYSYQTSVTSVSVDHCDGIESHSSVEMNTHTHPGSS